MHRTLEKSNILTTVVDPTHSVNQLLRLYPTAGRVLNAFGIDTCCGGAMSLADATTAAGISLQDITSAIAAAEESARSREAHR